MISRSIAIRGLILVTAMAAFAACAMASPLTFPKPPETNPPQVTALASPLTFPQPPQTNPPQVTAMASPLTFPKPPQTNPPQVTV